MYNWQLPSLELLSPRHWLITFKMVSRCNSSLDLGRIWLDRSEYAITRSPITAPGVVMSAHEATACLPRDHRGYVCGAHRSNDLDHSNLS